LPGFAVFEEDIVNVRLSLLVPFRRGRDGGH